MLKQLTPAQVRHLVDQLTTCYEESLIDVAITLVMQDPQAADYLQSQIRNTLMDQELMSDLGDFTDEIA